MDKACTTCDVSQPLTSFYKHSDYADGRMKQCKSCKKASVNQRRAEAKKPMCCRCKQRKRLDGYDNMESGRRKATCRSCLAAKLKLSERGPRKVEPIPISEQFGSTPEHLMLLRKPLL